MLPKTTRRSSVREAFLSDRRVSHKACDKRLTIAARQKRSRRSDTALFSNSNYRLHYRLKSQFENDLSLIFHDTFRPLMPLT